MKKVVCTEGLDAYSKIPYSAWVNYIESRINAYGDMRNETHILRDAGASKDSKGKE